jgi:hypothetical protein
MSFLLDPFKFGGALTGFYALAYNTAAIDVDPAVVIPLDGEVADAKSIHNTVTNNSRFTIPSGWNGRYGRMTANFNGDTEVDGRILKNGATFVGSGVLRAGDTSGTENGWYASAPVVLATSDYFEVEGSGTSANLNTSDNSWACFELMPTTFEGALAKKSASQNVTGGGGNTVMNWGAEEYDLNSYHDNTTNNSRMTVPSGVDIVRCSFSFKPTSAVGGQTLGTIFHNGSLGTRGLPQQDLDGVGAEGMTIMSAPIAVSASDYFEAVVNSSTTTITVDAVDENWFSIEKLPSTLKYALVHRSGSTFSISGGGGFQAVDWDGEAADTDAWHSTGTNPSRLTVPSGVSYVRVGFSIQNSSVTGQLVARITKNGSSFIGAPQVDSDTSGTDNINGWSAIIPVTASDYFECEVAATNATSVATSVNTWFSIEEVTADPA